MSYGNATIGLESEIEQARNTLTFGYLVIVPINLTLNALVIVISLANGVVEKDFKYFILNLAIVDATTSIVMLNQAVNYLLPESYPSTFCYFLGLMFYAVFFYACYWALLGVTVQRFVVLFFPVYTEWFTPGKIALICVIMDACPILQCIPYGVWFGTWGIGGVLGTCTLSQALVSDSYMKVYATLFSVNNAIVIAIALVTTVLNAAICLKIRAHLAVVQNMDDRSRYKETLYLAIATILQVLAPLLFNSPLLIVTAYMEGLGLRGLEHAKFQLLYIVPVILCFSLNSTADSLISLFMLKPYRKALFTLVRGIFNGKLRLKDDKTVANTKPGPSKPKK